MSFTTSPKVTGPLALEHYHIVVISPSQAIAPVILTDESEAYEKFNRTAIGYRDLTGAIMVYYDNNEARFDDQGIVRWFCCDHFCMDQNTDARPLAKNT